MPDAAPPALATAPGPRPHPPPGWVRMTREGRGRGGNSAAEGQARPARRGRPQGAASFKRAKARGLAWGPQEVQELVGRGEGSPGLRAERGHPSPRPSQRPRPQHGTGRPREKRTGPPTRPGAHGAGARREEGCRGPVCGRGGRASSQRRPWAWPTPHTRKGRRPLTRCVVPSWMHQGGRCPGRQVWGRCGGARGPQPWLPHSRSSLFSQAGPGHPRGPLSGPQFPLGGTGAGSETGRQQREAALDSRLPPASQGGWRGTRRCPASCPPAHQPSRGPLPAPGVRPAARGQALGPRRKVSKCFTCSQTPRGLLPQWGRPRQVQPTSAHPRGSMVPLLCSPSPGAAAASCELGEAPPLGRESALQPRRRQDPTTGGTGAGPEGGRGPSWAATTPGAPNPVSRTPQHPAQGALGQHGPHCPKPLLQACFTDGEAEAGGRALPRRHRASWRWDVIPRAPSMAGTGDTPPRTLWEQARLWLAPGPGPTPGRTPAGELCQQQPPQGCYFMHEAPPLR